MRTREDMVQNLADAIKNAILGTQPNVRLVWERERPDHPTRTVVRYEGNFDLYDLADELFGRIS
jgi:hypothetical protein